MSLVTVGCAKKTTSKLLRVRVGLCDFVSVVTESSTGPRKRFREMIVAHVGVHGWVSPGFLLSGTRLSYGASAVARTSDRGHVVEV
jgi:hypothetical protein